MWGNIFLKPRNKFLDDGMGGKWKCNRRFYTVFSERKMGCGEECDESRWGRAQFSSRSCVRAAQNYDGDV